ncbi:MAG: outer membrane protein assembly factor BamC [Betaproteobacteria bacterium]|nr:outer membrane protein assembly factor BamC [Betaproteobacteria bacterium]
MRMTVLAVLLATVVFGGCSFVESKKIEYKSAGSLPTLEVPPDLILPGSDKRYVVPDTTPKGSATYSAYSAERGVQKPSADSAVLPSVDKVGVERAGSQRWLVVRMPAQEVWPVVKEFWQEMGFVIGLELPDAGVLETDWAENRARIPQDPIRNLLGKVLDSVYSTAERDKFRTRLEPGEKGTEIYISHRGMYEVYEGTVAGGDQGGGRTVWQPRPADPELEAEMLRRLMARFGVEDARARTLLADKPAEPRAGKAQGQDGSPVLNTPDGFDRAWRRVGLALDRIGFAVEDRNRAGGVYYVRYADADAAGTAKEKGFLSKLAFWSSDDAKVLSQRYRIRVAEKAGQSEVSVLQDDGKPLKTETAQRIINLLYEQLK